MPLETGTLISDLNVANPTTSDGVSQGDDHLRLLKSVIKATFPSVTGVVTATHTQINTAAAAFPIQSASLADGAVTYAKFQNFSANQRVLGRSTAGAGAAEELTVSGGLSVAAGALTISDLGIVTAKLAANAADFTKISAAPSAGIIGAGAAGNYSHVTLGAGLSIAGGVFSAPATLPRGYISGCIGSNGTDTANDINISAGVCRDSSDAVNITVAANTAGKQLDANWAVDGTTNSGMRNSAVGIANGTYHIYACRTAADPVATIYAYAGVAGTDADSAGFIATMLAALQAEVGGASYVYARRLFSIVRESLSIVQFTQNNDVFERSTLALDLSAVTNPGSAAVTRTLSVPVGLTLEATVDFYISSSSLASYALFSALSTTDEAPVAGKAQVFTAGGVGQALAAQFTVKTNTSAQVRSRLSASDGNTSLDMSTRSWRDDRGKNA